MVIAHYRELNNPFYLLPITSRKRVGCKSEFLVVANTELTNRIQDGILTINCEQVVTK